MQVEHAKLWVDNEIDLEEMRELLLYKGTRYLSKGECHAFAELIDKAAGFGMGRQGDNTAKAKLSVVRQIEERVREVHRREGCFIELRK